jgi:hypothetical protein
MAAEHKTKKNGQVEILTKRSLQARAERGAQAMLGVSLKTALKKLDRGELTGTIAEAELKGLRHLLQTA